MDALKLSSPEHNVHIRRHGAFCYEEVGCKRYGWVKKVGFATGMAGTSCVWETWQYLIAQTGALLQEILGISLPVR